MSTWKIGKIGEHIVEEYLKSSNWLTYPAPDERHPIDWILATKDKKHLCLADAKTKPRREKYYDTGINLTHYQEYEFLRKKYNLDMLLIFVDPYERKIYGNYLSKLTAQVTVDGKIYPSIERTKYGLDIIYFPLSNVGQISEISREYSEELNSLSKRNYNYDIAPNNKVAIQPALFYSPYEPKIRAVNTHLYDDPNYLKSLLLGRCCQCGHGELSPNSHSDYCEYKTLMLGG